MVQAAACWRAWSVQDICEHDRFAKSVEVKPVGNRSIGARIAFAGLGDIALR
jgi:hypothetical protein